MRLDKRGQGWSWANIGAALLVIAVVVVMFFGPVDSLRAGTQSATNKTAEFGDALKALNIEKLTSMDRDELSEDEKALLAETLEANAKSLMDEARKNIGARDYEKAITNLNSAKNLLKDSDNTKLLAEIDQLNSKIDELKKQQPWEEELLLIAQEYSLYSGDQTADRLLGVRNKLILFREGKYGRSRDLAGDLLEKVNDKLKNLGASFSNPQESVTNPKESYIELLKLKDGVPNGNDPQTYYLDLARSFVVNYPTNPNAIFDLYRRSEKNAPDTYTEAISLKELADYFYSIESLKGNSAYEYGRIIENIELKSALSLDNLNSVLHNRGVLIDEGYLPLVKWDIVLSPTLVYDPGVLDSEKTIQVGFPFSFLSKLNEGADVSKFNALYNGNIQLLTKENSNAYFSIDYPHNVGSYSPYFAQTTLGKNFERFDKKKSLPIVIRFWDKNDLFLGECLNYQEGSTAPSISYYLNEYNTNEGHIILPRTYLKCSTAGGKAPSTEFVGLVLEKYDSLENSERLVFKLDFLRPFKEVKEYSFS